MNGDFSTYMTSKSLDLYRGTEQGTLCIRIGRADHHEPDQRDDCPQSDVPTRPQSCDDQPCALITEHRMWGSRQQRVRFDGNAEAAVQLPAGDYTVTVTAPYTTPYREFVTVLAGDTTTVCATLPPQRTPDASFADLLQRNLIPVHDAHRYGDLTVGEGEHAILDLESRQHKGNFRTIRLDSIHAVKQVLGTPDTAFVGEHARFGAASDTGNPDTPIGENLTVAQRAAMQEYLYGNSRSVSHWEHTLNARIKNEMLEVYLAIFRDIDVGPNATLDVWGHGLICNTLSVHYSGRVRYRGHGPGKFHMNHYVRYGLLTLTGTVTQPWSRM